ncbi:MAG: hypothetical protein ACTHK2_06920 [Dokdonella sp.]|uniref:hypothetical protein n=1 Tax=Dokdonella sp. TaxID=2291710 RepID=UPI003F7E72C2
MSVRSVLILALVAVAGCASEPPKANAPLVARAPSAGETSAIARIETRGRAIYRQDLVAQRARDALAVQGVAMPLPDVGGWVVTERPEGTRASLFVEDADANAHVGADVLLPAPGKGLPEVILEPQRAPDPAEAAMYRARQTALANADELCGAAFGTVILPGADRGWEVYLFPESDRSKVIPLGPLLRFDVSADGGNLLSTQKYSTECISMADDDADLYVKLEGRPQDELPVPMDVFLSLTYPKPIMLATGGHLWLVENGRIKPKGP